MNANHPDYTSDDDFKNATREEIVAYLESWGFQCYDHESTGDLRSEAIANFEMEGPGLGPTVVKAS